MAFGIQTKGQVFGGNPSTTKWKQIGNDTFNIIFPSYRLQDAQKIVPLLQWQSRYNTNIGAKVKRVNIVLQSDVTYSNGYVGLGPFRSEFYLMPPTDPFALGSQDWTSNLAIHEYRHVQQYNNFNVGLSKTVGTIFGQNGRALFNALSVPDWFFEGDAVYNETKLSKQGRGRLPLFMNDFASLFLDGKNYPYQKVRNGSYVDYVPDHYALGYILVAYGYEKYGAGFWEKVTKDAAAFRSIVYPLQNSVKRYAGVDFSTFVANAMAFYKSQMPRKEIDSSQFLLPKVKHDIVDYKFPIVQDNKIFSFKNSRTKVPSFIFLDSLGEHRVATSAIAYDNYFSSNGKEIVYSSLQPDIRWGNREYSSVRILDINKGKERKIGNNERWFMPDISTTGDSLLVVDMNQEGRSSVSLLSRNGVLLDSIHPESILLVTYPKFYKDGFYFFGRNKTGEMGIFYFNFLSKDYKVIVPLSNKLLGYPNLQNDTLFFSCSANGTDKLCTYIGNSNKLYDVAKYPTGIYGGGKWNNKLVGSVFTAEGYKLAQLQSDWKQDQQLAKDSLRLLYFKQATGANDLLDKSFTGTTLHEKNYSKWTNPFSFHSLQPDWDDPNYTISLYGQNILNTVESQVYYNYNRNERYSSVGFSTMYGGWYVMPIFNISETFNRNIALSNGSLAKWNELNTNIGAQLPLNFTGGKMYRYLTLQSTINTNYIQWQGSAARVFNNRAFNYWNNTVSFSLYSQQAMQQIFPNLGVAISSNLKTGFTAKAYQMLTVGNVYLPGILPTHSVVLNAAYMYRDTLRNYSYSNGFPISRGYYTINYPRMWKLGINYHFPICYPDLGVGNLVYFLRLRGNVFYDYSNLKSLRYRANYHLRTVGGELYFDTKWWNQETLTFGIRYSNMLDNKLTGTGRNRWEFILPIGLFK